MTNEIQEPLHKDKMRATIRFNKKEFEKVLRMQKVMGVSIPMLIREALFKGHKWDQPLMTMDDVNALMVELRKQGTDIGNMSKIVNEGLRCGWNDSFNSLCRGYTDLYRILSYFRQKGPPARR